MSLINYIEHNPVIALIVGGIHLAASYSLHSLEIPTVIMQVFQIGAWSVTMVVGVISIYGAYKKHKKK